MAMLTVRNVTDEVHRASRVRTAQRGHSMEAEVREILEAAVRPQSGRRGGQSWARCWPTRAGGRNWAMKNLPSSSRCVARIPPAR